jgi:hypothetical protein
MRMNSKSEQAKKDSDIMDVNSDAIASCSKRQLVHHDSWSHAQTRGTQKWANIVMYCLTGMLIQTNTEVDGSAYLTMEK